VTRVIELPPIGVVVLTQGRRPQELEAGLGSVLRQRDVAVDVVVVGNGWVPHGLPAGVRGYALPENLGIPAGRHAGVALVDGELLFFLDDDARLADEDFLAQAAGRFAADPRLGVLQPRVDSPGEVPPTRWIPRLRKGDPRRSSPAFSLWEGALVVRRTAYQACGGWGEPYFYAHEGIELAWRMWDAGYTVWYAGDLRCVHPAIDPVRHSQYYRLNARNRVWLARRNLRWPLSWGYVGTWTLVQALRSAPSAQGRASLRPWWRGWWEGWRVDPGGRRPMRWSTVATMARHGRPPLV
jgi:GT2 family glycosyltransferase